MTTYRQLAGSCDEGPCPTFHIDPTSRDVLVQGYRIESPIPLPAGEDVVHIPADAWARLLRDMPARVLLTALTSRWRRSRGGQVVDEPATTPA